MSCLTFAWLGVNDCLIRVVSAHGIVRILLGHGVLRQQPLVRVLGDLGQRQICLCSVQVAERLLQLLIDFRGVDDSKQLALLHVRTNVEVPLLADIHLCGNRSAK